MLQGHALDLRTDLTPLFIAHPALAERFVRLRDRLDTSHDAEDAAALMLQPGQDTPAVAADRDDTAAAFTDLLTEIRGREGFGSFLLPAPPEELTREASAGPIVVFNISRYRSDALVVTAEGVADVELQDLDIKTLGERIETFEDALATARLSPDRRERTRAEGVLCEVLEWLWDTAAQPVLRHLGHDRAPQAGERWPRIWWAPGGLLGMLPLHAAGYHRREGAGQSVLDRVVSSYTPTVRALGYARSRRTLLPPEHSLIVAMPVTPGIRGSLDNVLREAELLARRLPEPVVLIEREGVEDADTPTRDEVVARLATAEIAHFCCHGTSHPSDPSRSQLFLHDHRERPFTVSSLTTARLHHAQLAYLSACETMRNRVADLADEGIHLASAFQLAGYPHVIATLWPINDAIAVDVADAFYAGLEGRRKTIDLSRSATALHDAVTRVRDGFRRRASPSLWAAYTHTGV
ncbi:CHAT domain-containing protein [Actinospica durhamensis]|uniref:CHAT domain-containing protein n=1 Tax=Actinospica durhamensis TaxID=1508375 RepID=A0A941EYX0_9ACTN|nr:CHAT domain-containing protein [Actinospica durhamensis]MBR7836599.1 CHAT domain-containing protein [Actinospica durhamensis]